MHSPMRHRCHFATFKQCQEWAKRLNRAIAHPSRLEDLFALAYHAWCLGGSADDEDQHVHLCRPGHSTDTQPGSLIAQSFKTDRSKRIALTPQCFFTLCMCVCRRSRATQNGNGGQEDGVRHTKCLESVGHKLQLQVSGR